MIFRLVIFFISLLFLPTNNVQIRVLYPVVGTYQGKSAQGMAIWADNAYLFNDGGHCRVLNLKSGIIEREFDLASSGKNMHVNTACFGNDIIDGNVKPVIYISEYKDKSRCFVENITDSSSTLIQTIQANERGKNKFVQTWVVDNKSNCLFAIARRNPEKGTNRNINVGITKYRLPKLTEGTLVNLDEKDVLGYYEVPFHNGIQGAKIRGRYLYIVTGLQEMSSDKINANRAIKVVDLRNGRIRKEIDLTYVTTNEPEDLDFYHGKALLYTGQNGGLYKIKY